MIPFRSKSKTLWWWIAVGITAALLFGAVLSLVIMVTDRGSVDSTDASVPLFETPAWQEPGGLLLRSEAKGKGALLLKHRDKGAVYRYDPNTQNFSLVPDEVWQSSSGIIGEWCGARVPPSLPKLHIAKPGQLRAGDQEVTTAGATVLSFSVSPSGDRVVVLSAEGPKSESILPFLGGGGASGQHYHQMFSLPDLMSIEKPVPLPLGSKDEAVTMCWSPDERYVVYADILSFRLSIVAVDIPRR